jgi:beta-lactamase regulating signal transducer with metallopeptidase domain
MNFVNSILPKSLTDAIGWTIVHSIWEGLVIGVILFAALSFIHDSKSRLRYNFSVTALCLFILISIINLTAELIISTGISETALVVIQNNTVLDGANGSDITADQNSLRVITLGIISAVGVYLKSNLPLVVTLWFAGMIFFVTRFFGGFSYLNRMKYQDSSFVPAEWQNKLNSFRYKLKLKKPVRLLESAKVNIPVAIGYIKPIILVPVGMLTGFPAKEIEAIIAHELAHVARNDYLVNILQSIAEIIFFYNPALWWISSIIRSEREKCCDDIAVSLCGDSLIFANALAKLEKITTEKYQLALAINGKKNLVTRIKRLFNRQKETTMIEKTFAAGIIGIMLLTATVFASTLNTNGILSPGNEVETIENAAKNPSSQNGSEEIDLTLIETGIRDMYKSSERLIPADTSDTDKELLEEKKLKLKLKKEEELKREEEKKMREKEEQMRIEEKKMREKEEQMRIEEKKMRKEEEKMRLEEKKMHEYEEQMKIEETKMRKEEEIMRKKEAIFMDKLEGFLLKEEIIKKGEDFSLKLNQDVLYVNGDKQPDEILQKVKHIYKTAWGKELKGSSSFQIKK